MDIVERLRLQANHPNASLGGQYGGLLNEAAEEIVRLRDCLEGAEETCKKGYAQAYEIIKSMQDRLQKQKEESSDKELELLQAMIGAGVG